MFHRKKETIPYGEIDHNIVPLVRAINRFDGIQTVASCGGHTRPKNVQLPKGQWEVVFQIEQTEEGWFSLEFLAWCLNGDLPKAGRKVNLAPTSSAPYLNFPGRMLAFSIEAQKWDPEDAARTLEHMRKEYFVKPAQMKAFVEYSHGKKALKEYLKEKRKSKI